MASATDRALQRKAGDKAFSKAMDSGADGGVGDTYFADQDSAEASKAEATKQSKQDKARVGAIAKAKGLATSEAAKLDDESFMRASKLNLLKK